MSQFDHESDDQSAATNALVREMKTRNGDTSVTPPHYKGDYVMRVIEDFGLDFCDGTVVKYLLRAGNKPGESSLRDHQKAAWYLNRKIQQLQSANAEKSQPTNEPGEEHQSKKNKNTREAKR